LSRPDLFFAVTVNPSFRQSREGRDILRRYDYTVTLASILAFPFIGMVHFGRSALVLAGILFPVFIEIAGMFGAFLAARRRATPYHVEPTTEREATLQPREVLPAGGWLAQAGPFLILSAITLWLWLRWGAIPARIPIHWGVRGEPDGWAAKSVSSVFGVVAVGFLICSFVGCLWYATLRAVRRIHSSGSRGRHEAHFIRAMSFFLLGTEYWLALLMGLFGLAALRPHPEAPLPAMAPILLGQTLLIGAIFFIAYRTGQGGWRLRAAGEGKAPDSAPVGDRTPDECWKLGVFYFNPDDPVLFVEKRFGIGWTLNFANPKAIFVFGAILLFMLASLTIGLLASR
jgi:uncharacterized membrane protein